MNYSRLVGDGGVVAGNAARSSAGTPLPIETFLNDCIVSYRDEAEGDLANYIPELAKANPDHFGISVATIDGHVHEAGDSHVEFTIQSISKAFVFALALELCGPEVVAETIGVEPSGDPFNSIRLNAQNRPFNSMVNAGAIACTGLLYNKLGRDTFGFIQDRLGLFAGRTLDMDESVFRSELASGDRNRAIAWLLRSNDILHSDVDYILEMYFRQCSLLVTSRDLAIMGATLACAGVNPVTGRKVISPEATARGLSVMVSAGMYDFSGEWLYRVGLPAKSGVGGGIVAVLPAQLGLGTFSPLIDALGNSVRGVKVCERLSDHFGLHLMNRTGDVRTSIAADFDMSQYKSSRDRHHEEASVLEQYGYHVRVIELCGALNFVNCDYICRTINSRAFPEIIIISLSRVTGFSKASARLLADQFSTMMELETRVVIVASQNQSAFSEMIKSYMHNSPAAPWIAFEHLDEAINWAEDQVIFLYGGFSHIGSTVDLSEQPLLKGMSDSQLSTIREACDALVFRSGEPIIFEGEVPDSVFFLTSGVVGVRLSTGTRVASLDAGTCFGEMALVNDTQRRSADVIADVASRCLRLSLEAIDRLRQDEPAIVENIMHNLAALLAERLQKTNLKLDAIYKQ